VVIAAGPASWSAAARESLRAQLGTRLVAEATDADRAVAAVTAHRPSVVAVDHAMLPARDRGLVAALRRAYPPARILAVSSDAGDVQALDVIRQGGHGLLAEAVLPGLLAKAVRCVAAGQAWLTRRQEAQALAALWQAAEGGPSDPPGAGAAASPSDDPLRSEVVRRES
jgi:DNA-binding NarL/FixJ family response regulator